MNTEANPVERPLALAVAAQEKRYFEALAAGRFEIPCCDECSRWHFYPRVVCPYCGSEDLHWRTPSGLGTVYSTTTVRKNDGADYCVCLVDLDEGPRMMSTVCDISPLEVRIGMRVRARIRNVDGGPLLVFQPEGAAA